jgi:hypothetical protein
VAGKDFRGLVGRQLSWESRDLRPSIASEPRVKRNRDDSLAALTVDIARRARLPRNLNELEKASGWAVRTLRLKSDRAKTTAKALLDFIWCLKTVCTRDGPWDPRLALLDYKRDPRTIDRLLHIARLDTRSRPSVRHFVDHQCFITSRPLRDEICLALRHRRAAA